MVSNGNNLFYINTVDNVILQLTCTNSLEDCQWNILASKLEIPRKFAFLTLIPDHLTLCSTSKGKKVYLVRTTKLRFIRVPPK